MARKKEKKKKLNKKSENLIWAGLIIKRWIKKKCGVSPLKGSNYWKIVNVVRAKNAKKKKKKYRNLHECECHEFYSTK